ncbi:PA1571 family protein [Atopomonas sediminilitoris]|uniref:PA1571 family protein n=1 Tax=Atopomonas sediminilitoris TaxID=2919919 RepID=UPI001F4D724D|nr:PA1571 family protein [Atopomonas sediminilitoris]MCJ8169165.1 hypothetical protein [Atopomonas sediminilitoris]
MSSSRQSSQNNAKTTQAPAALGFLVDEQGREKPITEAMIQQACRELAAQNADLLGTNH